MAPHDPSDRLADRTFSDLVQETLSAAGLDGYWTAPSLEDRARLSLWEDR